MIHPSTFLRAAIFRCESNSATVTERTQFQRLMDNARAFTLEDTAEVVVSRLDFRQVALDVVRTLAAELIAGVKTDGKFIMAPAPDAPSPDYPAQLRQAVQDIASAQALLAPIYAYIAVANGAEPWLAMERRRPPAAPLR
jgi:hypothetical protein